MELALPILEKVYMKTLQLKDYNLSNAQLKALYLASRYFDNFVNKIFLDNNGVTDEQFASIVDSFWCLSDFKSIVYKNNEFGLKSAESVLNLSSRRQPYHLDELMINHCKITPKAVCHLFSELIRTSYISKLSLVNANLNIQGLSLISQMIRTNKFITHLDLSWNNAPVEHWREFLEAVRANRRLKFLNLSWNTLIKIKKLSTWQIRKNPKLMQPPKPSKKIYEIRFTQYENFKCLICGMMVNPMKLKEHNKTIHPILS